MILNSNEIKAIIPHRYPMLLVDQITEMEIGKYAIGKKAVSVNESFFQGHFPDYHVMPGVLIVESLAQVGAVLLLSEENNKGKIAFFAGIDKVKFKKQVIPGDILILKVELIKKKGSIGIGKAEAYVNDELAVRGELKFAVQ